MQNISSNLLYVIALGLKASLNHYAIIAKKKFALHLPLKIFSPVRGCSYVLYRPINHKVDFADEDIYMLLFFKTKTK